MATALSSLSNLFSKSLSFSPPSLPLRQQPTSKWAPVVATVGPSSYPHSCSGLRRTLNDVTLTSIVYPSVAHAKNLIKSTYNVQVIVEDNEPEDRLVNRFRRAVAHAGVIQECKRRRFFENSQQKKKRKAREAAKRNRKRRPPKSKVKEEAPKKKASDNDEDDNWELPEGDLPY